MDTYKVALVFDISYDQHWYRQDSDGFWSHKCGTTTNVSRIDASGNLIVDPQYADRTRYTTFVDYYALTPWGDYS